MLNDKSVLVTGGTGSFGKRFVGHVLENYKPKRLIVFSRDELKQFEMREHFPESKYPSIRYFIGDVRDAKRLYRAFEGVDIVIHAAALKQVPAAEYNPIEAIRTNIDGAINVIDAALDRGVQKVVALSTDKAANPINLYGATKLCSDKLFTAANAYRGAKQCRFAVVRYGNVVGSRGSVIPYFLKMKETGVIPITDKRMTRFWITLDQGVEYVLKALNKMDGGEIFVPKIPSMNIMDLAQLIAPEAKYEFVGVRPGEKLHETLISKSDARTTFEFDDFYVILPAIVFDKESSSWHTEGKPCSDGFGFASDTNLRWLTSDQLKDMIDQHESNAH